MDQVARTVLGLLLLAAVACVVPLVDGVRQGVEAPIDVAQ